MSFFRWIATAGLVLPLAMACGADAFGQSESGAWPQWRGPDRTGEVKSGTAWPDSLDEDHLKLVWETALQPSYSGPLVVGNRVFVTQTVDKKNEVVLALERTTGKELWRSQWPGAMSVPFFAKSNGDWIRATPTYDDGLLFVAGMRDVLVCLDAESGATKWKVNFVEKFKAELPAFGFVCSPLVDGDFVYVQAGGGLVKLNKQTGETIWRTLDDGGGMNGSAFSSPIMTELQGKKQLLVQTRTSLAGVDPDQGSVLWKQEVPAFRGMNILTPTQYENGIFTSSYGGKSFLFEIQADGGQFSVAEKWNNKAQGYMSSPLLIGDHAYLHLRNQRFTCMDLRTGEEKWRTKPYGKYWSSVYKGNKILALDERGELLLIRANPDKFELLSQREVSSESAWAHLAVSGDEIYVRSLNGLHVYRWSDVEATE